MSNDQALIDIAHDFLKIIGEYCRLILDTLGIRFISQKTYARAGGNVSH